MASTYQGSFRASCLAALGPPSNESAVKRTSPDAMIESGRMAATPESHGQAGATARIVSEEEQFRAILESPSFQKAPAVRSLLLYLWCNRGQPVSEYAIATEALGRKPDFDPRLDATVRVLISRLRQKLKEFYEIEGKGLALRISIPLGGHQLEVQLIRQPEALPPLTPVVIQAKASGWSRMALAISCAILSAICLAEYTQNRRLSAQVQRRSPLPRFWETFFANGKKTNLFLPTPVFFEWTGTNLKLRDPQVNEFTDFDNSTELKQYTRQWGSPKLLQNYTVASDTFAALKLIQYSQDHGVALGFGGTADFSPRFAGHPKYHPFGDTRHHQPAPQEGHGSHQLLLSRDKWQYSSEPEPTAG